MRVISPKSGKFINFERKYVALGLDLIELHACNSLINPAPSGRRIV